MTHLWGTNTAIAICVFCLSVADANASENLLEIKNEVNQNGVTLLESSTLAVRNPYNAKHHIESQHFAYWYDDKYLGNEDVLYLELERMEYSWQQLIEVMGYNKPLDNYKLNIYLEYAGSSSLPYEGYTGQAKIDDDGYPYLMMGEAILGYEQKDAHLHSSHEFFHNLQHSYGEGYGVYRDNAKWFMEASAGWAAIQVWQEPLIMANYIFSLAPTAKLSLDAFLVRQNSSIELTPSNVHHYSMAILLKFISDKTSSNYTKEVIESLATDIDNKQFLDALPTMGKVLNENYGLSLSDVAAEFHAKNIFWDYEVGQQLRDQQEALDITNTSRAVRILTKPSSNWVHLRQYNTAGLPHSTGAAYVYFNDNSMAEVELSFVAKHELASLGEIEWRITAVTNNDGKYNYQQIDVNAGQVDKTVVTLNNSGEVWLSFTPLAEIHNTSAEFEFSLQLAKSGESSEYQEPPIPADLNNDIINGDTSQNGGTTSAAYITTLILLLLLKTYRIKTGKL